MDKITYIMGEITRLRIENAELRKNLFVRQNLMRSEPLHYRSRATMSDQMSDNKSEVMFSDNKGFEQFAGPDYGEGTRAEKFGFMSTAGETSESENRRKTQRKLHKFSNYPIGIGNKYF
jgi:hypothetical protein